MDLPPDHTAPGRAHSPLQRPAPHRRRHEIERDRERDDDGEAEFYGEERRQDRAHDRGAAVDAPGPGHQLRQLAPDPRQAQGNGMPMQNASGAMAASASGSLLSIDRVTRNSVIGASATR